MLITFLFVFIDLGLLSDDIYLFIYAIFGQAGKADFEMLEKKAIEWGEPKVPSAKQVIT